MSTIIATKYVVQIRPKLGSNVPPQKTMSQLGDGDGWTRSMADPSETVEAATEKMNLSARLSTSYDHRVIKIFTEITIPEMPKEESQFDVQRRPDDESGRWVEDMHGYPTKELALAWANVQKYSCRIIERKVLVHPSK